MGGGVRNLHVRLSPEAYDALRTFAAAQGVTVTALIEATGLILGEGVEPTSEMVIARARRITFERHSRRRD